MEIEQSLTEKINTRTKPKGSLGKLEEIALKIGKIQNSLTPRLTRPSILVFAADHGIADEGVSPCPKEITHQMVMNFVQGGAGINVFCRQHDIALTVIDGGVDYDFDPSLPIVHQKIARGSRNMMHAPAMTLQQCEQAMAIGAQRVAHEAAQGTNIIGFGEMGIGNTSAASLLLNHYAGVPLEECVGRGAGLDEQGVNHKLEVLKKVAAQYQPKSALEALATFGGIEIAMICGGVLEAYRRGMVIVADGFIATSAFMAAYEMEPLLLNNVLFSHSSNEKGHRLMLEYLQGDPILQLDLRLGEGTGVAIAYPIICSALVFLNQMSSFEEAAVFQVHH